MKNQFNNTREQTKEFLKEMSPDEKQGIWKKGFEQGLRHRKPSKTTLEKFDALENKFDDWTNVHSIQHEAILERLKVLDKIAETYNGIAFMQNKGMKFLVALSVVSGLIWGWFAFLKPLFDKLKGG